MPEGGPAILEPAMGAIDIHHLRVVPSIGVARDVAQRLHDDRSPQREALAMLLARFSCSGRRELTSVTGILIHRARMI